MMRVCRSTATVLILSFVSLLSACDIAGKASVSSKEQDKWKQAVGNFVTVLKAKNDKPVFIVALDQKKKVIRVRNVNARKWRGKSYELWAIGANKKQPLSLGVIDKNIEIPLEKIGRIDPEFIKRITLAVSIEPKGGSLSGKPTGPVLYAGKLKRTTW